MDIRLKKRPVMVSLYDLKECMRAWFVPNHYRNELLFKLQRLHQKPRMVDKYFKDIETTLTKINVHDSEKSKIARFVSGLRREIKDIVVLYKYSYLEKLVHLAIKVESQLLKKTNFKTAHNEASRNLHGRIKTKFLQKLFLQIFQKKPLLIIEFLKTNLPPLPLSHPPKPQVENVLNV